MNKKGDIKLCFLSKSKKYYIRTGRNPKYTTLDKLVRKLRAVNNDRERIQNFN